MSVFNKYEKKIIKNQDKEIEFSEMEIKDEIVRKNLWINRRKMAWISFACLVITWLFILFSPDLTDNQLTALNSSSSFFSIIVLAYFGGNTFERIKGK